MTRRGEKKGDEKEERRCHITKKKMGITLVTSSSVELMNLRTGNSRHTLDLNTSGEERNLQEYWENMFIGLDWLLSTHDVNITKRQEFIDISENN